MVEVWLWVALGNLVCSGVLIWRVLVVESTLHDRVDEIDRSLGGVVGLIVEKIDAISANVPDINLINQNPIGQIIEFLKGNAPNDSIINSQHPPKGSDGQFIEVDSIGTKENKNEKTT